MGIGSNRDNQRFFRKANRIARIAKDGEQVNFTYSCLEVPAEGTVIRYVGIRLANGATISFADVQSVNGVSVADTSRYPGSLVYTAHP